MSSPNNGQKNIRQILARVTLTTFAGAAILLASTTDAVAADPMQPLRLGFLQSLSQHTLANEIAYASDLRAMEAKLRERKDYRAALAVAAEIEATASRIASLQAAQDLTPRTKNQHASSAATPLEGKELLLEAHGAETEENAHFNPEDKVITGLQASGDAVYWRLPENFPGGGYEVLLDYAASDEGGGSIHIVSEGFFLEATIHPTGGRTMMRNLNLGTLKIPAGAETLQLVARSVFNEHLMQLRSLRLRPAFLQP